MENILLDERGEGLVALVRGHPVHGNVPSIGSPPPWAPPLALFCPPGHLKLADFGLSRHLRCGERAHTICGTLQYMGKGTA